MAIVRQFALLEKETGEVVSDHVLIVTKNPKYLDRDYVKVFVTFLEDVVVDERVAGKAIRLLLYMLRKLDYNTLYVTIHPQEAMKELNISEMTFHRWKNILLEAQYITKIDVHTYQISALMAVKGSSQKAHENDVRKSKHKKMEIVMESLDEKKTVKSKLKGGSKV